MKLPPNEQWQEYKGDPWPSVRIPRKDLERIAEELMAGVEPALEMYQVCEMFNVQMLQDYWLGTDEHPELGHTMFYLGAKAEPAAGLRSFTLTPWFETQDQLWAFCRRNINKFRDWWKENPDGPAPDATNWA